MIGNNSKLLVVTALLLAVLLAGCSLEDIPVIGEYFKPAEKAQEQTVSTTAPTSVPETTKPPETTAPQPTETEPEKEYWIRAEGGLNVRSGPGTNYEILGRLDNGTQVYPQRWQNGWAYIVDPVAGWISGDYLFDSPPEFLCDPAILGSWIVPRAWYADDGLFHIAFDYSWTFNEDGTFQSSQNETQYLYNPDGTQNTIWGTGGHPAKGTYTFDGNKLVITITHRFEESSGPYIEQVPPIVLEGIVTFAGEDMVVSWLNRNNKVETFYRGSREALVKRLMEELKN